MKKFLLITSVAVALTLVSQQKASAWVNFRFSAGVNWQWQSGGNTVLWGLFRGSKPMYPLNSHPQPNPYAHYQGIQYFGGTAPDHDSSPAPKGNDQPPQNGQAYNSYNSQYQNANHHPQGQRYYQMGYYGQVPSYWYGRR